MAAHSRVDQLSVVKPIPVVVLDFFHGLEEVGWPI